MSLSACESWEQVSCGIALLASDVVEIVEHDNGEMFDEVEFDNIVDVELCDGEKRLPLLCSLSFSLCLLFLADACYFLVASLLLFFDDEEDDSEVDDA